MGSCPRCLGEMSPYPAISRRDNKTEICNGCGLDEAIIDFNREMGFEDSDEQQVKETRLAKFIKGESK